MFDFDFIGGGLGIMLTRPLQVEWAWIRPDDYIKVQTTIVRGEQSFSITVFDAVGVR